MQHGWISQPSVTYVTSSSDSSDASDHSDSEIPTTLRRSISPHPCQPTSDQDTSPNLTRSLQTIRQLRMTIQEKDLEIVQMAKELDQKSKSIRYYVNEIQYLHSKLSLLEGDTPNQKRTSYRSHYACGVCKRRPKSTACICNNKKRKKSQ